MISGGIKIFNSLYPFRANFAKWSLSNNSSAITYCLSVFDHFAGVGAQRVNLNRKAMISEFGKTKNSK